MIVHDLSKDSGLVERIYATRKARRRVDRGKHAVFDTGDGNCIKFYPLEDSRVFATIQHLTRTRLKWLGLLTPIPRGIVRCGVLSSDSERFRCLPSEKLARVPLARSVWGLYMEKIEGQTLNKVENGRLTPRIVQTARSIVNTLLNNDVVIVDSLILHNMLLSPSGTIYLIDPESYVFHDFNPDEHQHYHGRNLCMIASSLNYLERRALQNTPQEPSPSQDEENL